MIQIWKKTYVDIKSFIENFPQENYEDHIRFIYPNGREGKMIFWQTFLHFINHSTYHRGQLVTLSQQVGFNNFSIADLAT
ncbi:DinB family protein [Marinoscillum pacificum]|uniref:DinB family protein n=1 Tax=Marinoscillum pacificum TaxID=392723 RepID=UPI00358E9ECC